MKDLTLYTNPQSRGRVIRWMLEELEIPYETQIMEYGGSIKSPEYLAINPMGKVPAILHGDTVVTEVAAICAYLADRFPEPGLAPAPDSPERGTYYRWLFFAAGPLEMVINSRAYGWDIDDEKATGIGCGHCETAINTLEQAVKGASPYLCGDRFTAVDLLLSSYLGFFTMMKLLEPRPAFAEYVQRMEARPAAKRANEKDDALMQSATA
jgi:glutathione S-transferase